MKIALTIILSGMANICHATITYHLQLYEPKIKNYNALRKIQAGCAYYNPVGGGDRISILYMKASDDEYFVVGLLASKSLEMKLPNKVLKFIANRIVNPKLSESNSLDAAKDVLRVAVEKAMDQAWINALRNEGESFSKLPEYNRDNAGFDMNYYEFFPIEKNDITNPTTIDDTDLKKSFFEDSVLSFERTLLAMNGNINKVEDSNLKKPDFDRNITWQKYRYDNLMDVMSKLGSVGYHHNNLKVSDWPLANPKNWDLPTTTPADFHSDVDSVCKYLMILQPTLKKSELMPAMAWKQNYGRWKATRCNLFVGDFAMKALKLSTYPWGTRDWNANILYDALPMDGNFIPLDWNEAWLYATLGYPVFITTPKVGPAAHIGFAFPVDIKTAIDATKLGTDAAAVKMKKEGMVVQAGSSTGKMIFNKGFTADTGTRLYVYLGHLLN